MGSEERKGTLERLGDKLHVARSFLKHGLGGGGGKVGDSPGTTSPRSNEGSSSRGSSQISPGVQPLTLLFYYSRRDNVEGLQELLESSQKLASEVDYDERTALHIAATHGCLNAAKVLLDCGADVNAQDRWQNSPLADAKACGHEKMMKLLQSHGGQLLHSCLEVRDTTRYCAHMGCHGQEIKAVTPPTLRKSDWEVDPSEIDLSNGMKIGKGSFGEIRKAFWRGTPVAVKTILPALSDDKLVVQDFRHEVELLVKVRHPNIVQFLGAVTKRPPLMLITEYLPGGDLHVVLKDKGPLSAGTIVSYALDIARGLTYLHNGPNTIIHRDLKPRNVLLGENNQLKVGDFGLSKLIRVKSMHDIYKMTGETGSYRYMAPEVFEHHPYDKSVDVFSFAVILYEMFEGAPPFSHMDAYAAARLVAKDKRRPSFTSKHYPEGMIKLIDDCWQHNPADRPEFQNILPKLEKLNTDLSASSREHHIWPFTTSHSNHLT